MRLSLSNMKNYCCEKVDIMDDEGANVDNKSHLPTPNVLFPEERIQLDWRQLSVGSGLTNTGVICYINSTLQALFHIPAFSKWLMNDEEHQNACQQKAGAKNDCIVCSVRNTFSLTQKHTGSSFEASMITDRLSLICKDLSTHRQEDAHEFLCYLMESMERSYLSVSGHTDKSLDVYSKETTPVNQIFGGYIRTEVTCTECRNVSTTFQHFQDLILDIKHCDNITDALNNYFVGEQLSYVCEKCRREVVAEKKFSIEKAPNVLCVQLKRHDFGMDGSDGRKINKIIEINERLDLSGYEFGTHVQPLQYHLVSMIVHYGTTLHSGHYAAVGLTTSGSYYYFNDSDVYQTSFDKYSKSTDSYIMFYELDTSEIELLTQVPEESRPTTETLSDNSISYVKPSSIYNNSVSYLHIDSDKDDAYVEGVESTPLVMDTPHWTDQKVSEKKCSVMRPRIEFSTEKREILLPKKYPKDDVKTWNGGGQSITYRKAEQFKNNQVKRSCDENFDRGIVKKRKCHPEESWLQTLTYHPLNQNNVKTVKSVITWPNRSENYTPYYNNGCRRDNNNASGDGEYTKQEYKNYRHRWYYQNKKWRTADFQDPYAR